MQGLQRRQRSSSPSCSGGVGVGVATDGARGEVWRAVALQAHFLGGAGVSFGRADRPSVRPRPTANNSARSSSVGSRLSQDSRTNVSSGSSIQRRAVICADDASPSSTSGLGQYAELDYQEKLRRHQASLSLAQRMGLVAKPAQPLTSEQWEAIKAASDGRNDSEVPCSICLEDFRERPQVILSCSHVFHGECLGSFERFSGRTQCPLCRCPSYDATIHFTGFMVWRRKCASRIQRAWRGYKSRSEMYEQLKRPELRSTAPALHRRFCGRALQAIGGKLEKACEEREDALDRFLAELDSSVAQCSEQLREGLLGFEYLHGNTTAPSAGAGQTEKAGYLQNSAVIVEDRWAKARQAALSRGDEVDCPICFQPCQLKGRSGNRVELLSCSHVFHRCCVMSFESFHVFEAHLCPVCRQTYDRQPWEADPRPPRIPASIAAAAVGFSRPSKNGPAGRFTTEPVRAAAKASTSRPNWRALRAMA